MRPANFYLLDTSILLLLARGKNAASYISDYYKLAEQQSVPLISVISHGELKGFARVNGFGPEKLKAIDLILDSFVTVDIYSNDIIEAYVNILYYLKKVKKPVIEIGQNDIWIAATASVADAILLTTDRHFDYIPLELLKHEYIDEVRFKSS